MIKYTLEALTFCYRQILLTSIHRSWLRFSTIVFYHVWFWDSCHKSFIPCRRNTAIPATEILLLAIKTCQNTQWMPCLSLPPFRPVLRGRSVLSGAAPGLHMSLLWQDGLHRDVPTGACGCRAHRDLHRSGKLCAELHTFKFMLIFPCMTTLNWVD